MLNVVVANDGDFATVVNVLARVSDIPGCQTWGVVSYLSD